MQDGGDGGSLTVVVIGLNSAATIEACLESIRLAIAALARPVRVIYVDGGSTDGSAALAAGQGAEVIQLVTDRPTAAKGRNAGWRAASTTLVQFVDSDTTLDPAWLVRGTTAIRTDPRIASVFGHLHEANPTGNLFNEVCGHDWYIPPGDWRMCGGNALFRRGALEQVSGSDEALAAGEEADLCWRLRRLGWRIVCVDALMAHHDLGNTGFRAYWKRAQRSGYAYGEIGLRYARTDDPMWLREFLRNLLVPPAMLLAIVLVGRWMGFAGLAAMLLVAGMRFAWKFRSLRSRIPGAGQRARYLAHLAFVRIPLFVGSVKYLARWLSRRRTEG